MESNNNNNQSLFLCEFKELRKELSTVKKRIVQLEQSHEKQQERIDILERENHSLKTQLNINGNKEGGSALKRKRTDQKEEIESVSTSASAGKKKTKTNNNDDNDEAVVPPDEETESKSTSVSADKKKTKTNNNDDEEAVVTSRYDNGDSFDSLSDDLLHKIVEFDGNCYSKFGSINKRCKNIYDVEEYKLKKETCVFGYGTLDMMLEHYLQKRKKYTFCVDEHNIKYIAKAVIGHNRLDAIEWIIQLGDDVLLMDLCSVAAGYGRIDLLTKVFLKSNVTVLDHLLSYSSLCFEAANNGHLKTLKWLRKYGAKWNAHTLAFAEDGGHDEIVQYLRAEGCPETFEDQNLSLGLGLLEYEQFDSDDDVSY